MTTKKKNIPTLKSLRSYYAYIDETTLGGALKEFAGRLVPREVIYNKPTTAIIAFLTHYDDYFCLLYNGYRVIKVRGVRGTSGNRMPEDKLVWYYHKGKYPMHIMEHKNDNLMDSRIENLRVSDALLRPRPVADSTIKRSNVRGISYTTTQHNAHSWKVEYIKNTVREVACDADGVPLTSWASKNWHNRTTKMVRSQTKTFLGFYVDLEDAKRELRLHRNEVEHAICRWKTDDKIRTLCAMMRDAKGGVSEGVYEYLKMLSYRAVLPLHYVSSLADTLGHGNRPLPMPKEK